MKKYLFIVLLFVVWSCDDDEPLTDEQRIAGSYYLHSTSNNDSVEVSETHDSTCLVLKTVPWTPATANEEWEGEYSNTLKAETYYAYNVFGNDIVSNGAGVWALNADSIKNFRSFSASATLKTKNIKTILNNNFIF